MTNKNRSAVFGKLQRVLKKAFKTPEFAELTVMEHLLFGCLLENTHYDIAERTFRSLLKNFYDLNEIRVSGIKELAEILHLLPNPEAGARRLRGSLQHVFESLYKFDLEHLKKQNIGVAEKTLRDIRGISSFVVDHVVQAALGGHAIPLDDGALTALYVVGAISQSERDEGKATGLTRAIPKSKGQEFAFGLHELGAEFISHPHSPHVKELALSIDPDCKERLPKRTAKPEEPPASNKNSVAQEKAPAAPKSATASNKKGELQESAPTSTGKGSKPATKAAESEREDAVETASSSKAGPPKSSKGEKEHLERNAAEEASSSKKSSAADSPKSQSKKVESAKAGEKAPMQPAPEVPMQPEKAAASKKPESKTPPGKGSDAKPVDAKHSESKAQSVPHRDMEKGEKKPSIAAPEVKSVKSKPGKTVSLDKAADKSTPAAPKPHEGASNKQEPAKKTPSGVKPPVKQGDKEQPKKNQSSAKPAVGKAGSLPVKSATAAKGKRKPR